MSRLRTLLVTTADGPRDILILDKMTGDQVDAFSQSEVRKIPNLPPMLAFAFEVDIPEVDEGEEDLADITTHADGGHQVKLDVTGADTEFTKTIRRMTRNATGG